MAGPVINVTITGDAKDLSRTFGKVNSDAATFGKQISGKAVAAGAAIGTMAGQAIPGLVSMGSELFNLGQSVETMSKKADTVFGDQADDIRSWADGVNESMGLSDEAVVGLATNLGDLLVPLGFARDDAADMSAKTVELAGALSAWSGGTVDAASASEILTKAYLGERDALTSLGIKISEADVQARLAAKGQEDLTGAALDQAKAVATQELIFEKSADAQAAWNDGTMDAVKNQNELTAMWEDAKVELARGLVPIVQKVVKVFVRDVVPAIRRTVDYIRTNWPKIQAAMQPTIDWIRDTVARVIEIVAGFWRKYGDEIMAYIHDVWPAIEKIIGGVIRTIKGIIDTFLAVLSGDWGAAWQGIQDIVGGVLDMIAGYIELVLDSIQALFAAAWETVSGIVTGILDGIVDAILAVPGLVKDGAELWFEAHVDAAQFLVDWIGDRLDDIVGFFRGLPGRMAGLADGMFDGIKDAFRSAINWIIDAWNGLEFKIPGFDPPGPGPKFGGFTLGVPDIPRLADGGLLLTGSSGVPFIGAEAGYDELVLPLRDDVLDRLASRLAVPGPVHHHWPAGTDPARVAEADRRYKRRNGLS